MTEHGALQSAGTGEAWFRRAKNHYKWNSKTVCKVHGSGVICEEHAQAPDLFDQFIQRSLAREILSFPLETLQDFSGEAAITIRSDNHP
jgi:hypothetical protein